MENVKFKNSLKQHDFVFSLIQKVEMKLKEIKNYKSLKLNQELTKYVGEEMKSELDQKVDKKKILKQIISILKTNLLKLSYRFVKLAVVASI